MPYDLRRYVDNLSLITTFIDNYLDFGGFKRTFNIHTLFFHTMKILNLMEK